MKHLVTITLALAVLSAWSLAAQKPRAPAAPPARGSAPRPAIAERAVPFKLGETLTYDVSWSSFLTAGTVVVKVGEKRPSRNSLAYYIVAEGRPTPLVSRLYPLYYKLDTLLDAFTLLPQRGSLYSQEGTRRSLRTTTFDRTSRKASFQYEGSTTVKADFPVPPDVQDLLSALYVMRAMPLKAGGRMAMAVSNDGNTYTLQIAIAAPVRMKTALGVVSAWKLIPTVDDPNDPLVGRNIGIWLSDDARRLPVRVQGDLPVGTFVLTLRAAT
jgi:hypothetical protein